MRRLTIGILAAEGLLGLAWTALLLAEPDAGSWFLPEGIDPGLIRTFLIADVVFFALLPLTAALGLRRRAKWALAALWTHAGGIGYAALWGWGLVAVTGDGLLGALLMTPGAIVVPVLACRVAAEGADE